VLDWQNVALNMSKDAEDKLPGGHPQSARLVHCGEEWCTHEQLQRLKDTAIYRRMSLEALFKEQAEKIVALIAEPGIDLITIVTPADALVEIRARCLESTDSVLAVHRTIARRHDIVPEYAWCLTHVPTGFRFALFATELEAEQFATTWWGKLDAPAKAIWRDCTRSAFVDGMQMADTLPKAALAMLVDQLTKTGGDRSPLVSTTAAVEDDDV